MRFKISACGRCSTTMAVEESTEWMTHFIDPNSGQQAAQKQQGQQSICRPRMPFLNTDLIYCPSPLTSYTIIKYHLFTLISVFRASPRSGVPKVVPQHRQGVLLLDVGGVQQCWEVKSKSGLKSSFSKTAFLNLFLPQHAFWSRISSTAPLPLANTWLL